MLKTFVKSSIALAAVALLSATAANATPGGVLGPAGAAVS